MPWAVADRTTLTEQAAQEILRQIKDGTFKPGDKLPSQRELSHMMGVGISAVREALQRLEVLGVVEVRQGHHTTVRPFSHQLFLYDPELFLLAAEKETLDHVFEAREALETSIVALAAERAMSEDVQAIRRALEQQIAEDHGDYETHRRLNNEFHLAVAAASHNPVLSRMLAPLLSAHRLLKTIHSAEMAIRWVERHRAIYEAIRDHDPAGAQAAMRDHIDLSREERRTAFEAMLPPIPSQEDTQRLSATHVTKETDSEI